MINVTQKSKNTFIIEWDHEDPEESIFNAFTEEDFIEVLRYYAEKSLSIDKYSSQSREESQETDYYDSESEGKDHKLSSQDIYEAAFKTNYNDEIYHQTNEAS
jgi:hypothetical protein